MTDTDLPSRSFRAVRRRRRRAKSGRPLSVFDHFVIPVPTNRFRFLPSRTRLFLFLHPKFYLSFLPSLSLLVTLSLFSPRSVYSERRDCQYGRSFFDAHLSVHRLAFPHAYIYACAHLYEHHRKGIVHETFEEDEERRRYETRTAGRTGTAVGQH